MGFTQEGLANQVGVEVSTMSRWERGDLTPQAWRRRRIATALDVSMECLNALLAPTSSIAGAPPAELAFSGESTSGRLDPGDVMRDARDAARFAREVTESRVSAATLDQVQQDIHRFSADYVSRPVVELYNEVREVRSQVFRLVRANRVPNQMRQLYLEASRASGLQAHVCLDLGDYSAAHMHARTAFLCA
ncbi:MAG: helix-turn-helix domain-containing protein, partial [Actinomycetota bacterium]|nr:helix-turn-helix domain-containing protein [Actinomycetota bacterium]